MEGRLRPRLPTVHQPLTVVATLVVSVAGAALALAEADPVARCREDPTLLRNDDAYRELLFHHRGEIAELAQTLARDDDRAWDLRALALLLVDADDQPELWIDFVAGFEPMEVAADEWGAEAFNAMSRWMPHRGRGRELAEGMILPEHEAVLGVLAGQGVHEYVAILVDRDLDLEPRLVTALGNTDDQDTRRLLNWLVGHCEMHGMEGYLVDQVAADRPSTYPSQARRVFEFFATGGISELFRAMGPEPEWLGPETTPKGLALSSLGVLLPPGQKVTDRILVQRLLSAAERNAPGHDRGQWQLAVDILRFLEHRSEPLRGRTDAAVDALARQVLRKKGPLEPFVAAEALHRSAGVPLPRFNADERHRIWTLTEKTLEWGYLGAVMRAVPDPERGAALRRRLVGQKDAAVRGSLRVVRCWGCDIEGPGDWARAVAELGMGEMLPAVEQVLELSWGEDDTVMALVALGEPGVPALVRFLRGPRVNSLDEEPMAAAIRLCLRHLPADERETFLAEMRAGLHTREVARRVELPEAGDGGAPP